MKSFKNQEFEVQALSQKTGLNFYVQKMNNNHRRFKT